MVKRKYRPCDEEIPKGCDTATRKNTIKQRWKLRRAEQLHPYEIVGLQSSENQITDFDHLAEVAESEIEEGSPKDLLNPLRMWYTSETVDALVDFYGNGLSQLSDSCRLFMV